MTARIGTNMTVRVESTRGSAIAVTAITLADPGVATSVAHGLANGDVVEWDISAGMVELAGQAVRVANVAADTFELEGLDTTDYTTWTAGDAYEITAFHTLSNAQSITMPNPAPERIDVTTLIDKTKQYLYGLADAPDGSITGIYDPLNAGVVAIKAATKSNTDLVFKIDWAGGQFTIFNASVSGGTGFDLSQNAAATAPISFTPVKDVMDYAS